MSRRHAEQERKAELIRQMGSPFNNFALEAVRLLGQKGWLTDGSLQSADLFEANLQGAILRNANLQRVDLSTANLSTCDLTLADLSQAEIRLANLREAQLNETNLEGINLAGTDLTGAYLEHANLQGANLEGVSFWNARMFKANLKAARNIEFAVFSKDTWLPDGTLWCLGRDLRQFTHPEEWQLEQIAKGDARLDSGIKNEES
jgi:uncharacterized protein YjbI with pentapeptide repeats